MGQYTTGWMAFDSTVIKATNVDYPTNAEVTGDGSGGLDEETLSLTNFAPVATVTSPALATLLSTVGLYGVCVKSGGTVEVCDVISRRLETCKDPLTATPHYRKRCTVGLLRLGTLTAARNQDATLTAILDTFTDGSNGPVAVTDGVAAPATVQQQRYRLGLSKVAGVQLDETDDISLEFAVELSEKTPSFGSIWPDSAGVLTVRPVLTIRGRDLAKVQTGVLELGANAATHANTLIQLIKLASSGSYESFGSGVHISLTVDGLAVPDNLASGSAGGRATNTLRLPLRNDGTNAPVVISTTATYDTNP